jgi:hypothetical protein
MAEIRSGKLIGKDGRRRWWWCSDVDGGSAPTISRRGEVDDDVQLLAAVTKVSSEISLSSHIDGDVRMEMKISGDTPARNYRRFGDLQMGKKGLERLCTARERA